MANRANTILSDENMRKICFEGKPPPLGRLDLLMPPPNQVTPVYYRPTKTIPRMQRPETVASMVNNLSSLSRTPKPSLYQSYREIYDKTPATGVPFRPRYGARPRSSAEQIAYINYTQTVGDITDEIFEALLNAQVYGVAPEASEDVGIFGSLEALETAEPYTGPPPLDFPIPGHEVAMGYSPARAGGVTEMTDIQKIQAETRRRQAESKQGRPVRATLGGLPGRPTEVEIGFPPVTGLIGQGMPPLRR